MITYDYTSVKDDTVTSDDFLTLIKFWGGTGWKFVCVYNGYVFFEKATRTEMIAG